MDLAIQVQIEELPEGLFLATSDELSGLVAQGRTVAEALEIARDVARKLLEASDRPPPRQSGNAVDSRKVHRARRCGVWGDVCLLTSPADYAKFLIEVMDTKPADAFRLGGPTSTKYCARKCRWKPAKASRFHGRWAGRSRRPRILEN